MEAIEVFMKNTLLLPFLFLLTFTSFAEEQKTLFKFNFKKGDASSYISTVEEQAFINGRLNNQAQIINRISSSVLDTTSNGAIIETSYMTTENSLLSASGRTLTWGEESKITFERNCNGEEYISDSEFMPTVRNVPTFPDNPVQPGDTWQKGGKEVHDLRKLFNMDKPVIIPFTANYTYLKDINENETTYSVIEVYYEFFLENPMKERAKGSTFYQTAGYSTQVLYWEKNKGILDHYDEEFQIQMSDIFGNLYVFQGTANAQVTEFHSVNDEQTIKQIQKTLKESNLKNITVKKGEKGLTISIDNIQFMPDSNVLMASEKAKIEKIAQILKQYPNDLLITGHCAERGTENARQKLSEERAESVANALKELNVRDSLHIFTQGMGSRQPIASNLTEEGRSKNRRVEITLMD